MEKKKPQNKAVKKVDLNDLPDSVTIIGQGGKHITKGKEYIVTREIAVILINKGVATLK